MKGRFVAAAALLAALLASAPPAAAVEGSAPPAGAGGEAAPDGKSQQEVARSYFSDLPLVTHDGREVRFYSDVLKGRVVLINSFYTSCEMISPRQAQVLGQLQRMLGERLGRDVFIISITIDPEHDTPEKIREWARDAGAGPGWIFLTGKRENVDWVNSKLGQHEHHLHDHKGVYLLGNVETTLWMKLPAHAMAIDLYRQIQILLEDEGVEEDQDEAADG